MEFSKILHVRNLTMLPPPGVAANPRFPSKLPYLNLWFLSILYLRLPTFLAILRAHPTPKAIMEDIKKYFTIKDDKYGSLDTYLGSNIEKVQLDDGSYAWRMHSQHYVKSLIQTIEDLLLEDGRELKGTFKQKTHSGPLSTSYKPELDNSQPCSEEHASHFRQIIGILSKGNLS